MILTEKIEENVYGNQENFVYVDTTPHYTLIYFEFHELLMSFTSRFEPAWAEKTIGSHLAPTI